MTLPVDQSPPSFLHIEVTAANTTPFDKLQKLVKIWKSGIVSNYKKGLTDYPMIPKGSIKITPLTTRPTKNKATTLSIVNLVSPTTPVPSRAKRKLGQLSASAQTREDSPAQRVKLRAIRRKPHLMTHLLMLPGEGFSASQQELRYAAIFWGPTLVRNFHKGTKLPPRFPANKFVLKYESNPSEALKKTAVKIFSLLPKQKDDS